MADSSLEQGGLNIRNVPVADVIGLRHQILRAGLPVETARFEGDDEPTAAHFAAFDGSRTIGCATVLQRPWNGQPAWQVRGMAVAADCRLGGIGRGLLIAIERHVAAQNASLLWCNARSPAVGFYKLQGWRLASEEFDIPSAGPHFKMIKDL